MEKLLNIIKKLRAPDGCPWDQKQTHKTLKRFLIEESYEVLETIDNNDYSALKEELGDVLLQVLLHSEIASEKGEFSFTDVVETLSKKLVHRHPHVFGDKSKLRTAEEVEKQWEKQKNRESLLEGLPRSMPPLLQVYRISERVSRVGFEWESIDGVLEKIDEELNELKLAISEYKNIKKIDDSTQGQKEVDNKLAKIDDELGDLIFTSVQIARFLKRPIDEIMDKNIAKFIKRFKKVEKYFKTKNVKIEDASFEELNNAWELAKK